MLHLSGRVTDAVFGFLGPATEALAAQGVAQTVVMIDDPSNRHLLPRFHESVRLVLTRGREPVVERLGELLDAYCHAVRSRGPALVHLHGSTGAAVGLYAACFRGIQVGTCFTPHGASLLPRLGHRLVGWLGRRPAAAGGARRTIANSRFDAETLAGPDEAVDLIENPVAPMFFETPRAPDAVPCLITSSRSADAVGAARFAQCAVLAADQTPMPRCEWIGPVLVESAERLKAARVQLFPGHGEAERAGRLSRAWIYLAPSASAGSAVGLAEAMALGLACVAWDTPHHRALLTDGDTGFLCADSHQALSAIAALLESAALRERCGTAARADARRRFDTRVFSDSLLGAYDALEAR